MAIETNVVPEQPKGGLLRRFARSRKGVAAIEFGMVSIPFLGLLCAIFETAFVFFVHEALDDAVSKTARAIATNQFATTTQTAGNFVNAAPSGGGATLCNSLPSFIPCANLVLNSQNYNSSSTNWSSITPNTSWYSSNTGSTNLNLGSPGDIVVFQVYYPMPVYLSVLVATGVKGNQPTNLWQNMANSGSTTVTSGTGGLVHAIFSTAVFRNEP